MPKRPAEHEIEDISRAKFTLAIPRNWLFRDKLKDYGIDGEVEIFDEKKNSTGISFWVQLKATEALKKTIKFVDLSIDAIKYYKKLGTPVLLARYSHSDDTFFYKWVNNIDLFYAKKNAKTYRIKFTDANKWNDKSAEQIKVDLLKYRALQNGTFSFPVPISVEVQETSLKGKLGGIILSQIRTALSNYSNFVTYTPSYEQALIKISLSNTELLINAPCDSIGCVFHSIALRDEKDFSENIAKDIVLGIAVGMIQIGQKEFCGRIIFESKLDDRLTGKEEIMATILPDLLQTSFFEKTLDLVGQLMDTSKSNNKINLLTKFFLLYNYSSDDENRSKIIEAFLLKRIKAAIKSGNKNSIGIANYNIGNFYKNKSLYHQAISHYIKAKRYEPIYLKQHYYYKELGGMFFLLDKFRISSNLYSRAIKMGAPPETLALYADSLMFDGQYGKAQKTLVQYLKKVKKPLDEFHLKTIMLDGIIKSNGNQQKRNIQKASLVFSKINPALNIEAGLNNVLECDMLFSSAWFNLGVHFSQTAQAPKASYCFTMCGLTNVADVEAWVNATISSFNKESLGTLPLIVRTAHFFNKDKYLESLYSHIASQIPHNISSQMVTAIEQILPQEIKREIPEVRIFNSKSGLFENLLGNKNEK